MKSSDKDNKFIRLPYNIRYRNNYVMLNFYEIRYLAQKVTKINRPCN